MAILDLTQAKQAVFMDDPNLVNFNSKVATAPTRWNWFTSNQNLVDVSGAGMTFDAAGRAIGGVATSIGIDLGNDDFDNPDISISGFETAAAALDNAPASFWRVLAGDDTIICPLRANVGPGQNSLIFGDGIAARIGASSGGEDLFEAGDARTEAYGDVVTVGRATAGSPAAVFTGGNDTMSGLFTALGQQLIGDVREVLATGKLIGGNDTITMNSTTIGSTAVGDAFSVLGTSTDRAEAVGGSDVIVAGVGSGAILVGDVVHQNAFSFVDGGNDEIDGSEQDEVIAGDVINPGHMVGGGDEIFGNGGDDIISGDAFGADGGTIAGGNDIIDGGEGSDRIFGEFANGTPRSLTAGHDFLFGGAGDDVIHGQTGNDIIDGGTEADTMAGGAGNDIYFADGFGDVVTELAGEGIDTLMTMLNDVGLIDHVENLRFIGTGNFKGGGNALSNRITGGNGDDRFIADGSGRDVYVGLDGFDILDFSRIGAAVINLASNVHGGSAAGDRFSGIESILGSQTGADRMTAGNAGAIFSGLGGDDILCGGMRANVLHGGDGNDRLDGGAGSDIFLGGEAGNDTIAAGSGNDTADGGDDNDTLSGQAGSDMLSGGGGNDRLDGGAGADRLDGGGDFDFASYGTAQAGVAADLLLPVNNIREAKGDIYVSIEGLVGSRFHDVLSGDDANNTLLGGDGSDLLIGRLGNDRLDGQAGNDVLSGGAGADIFAFTRGGQVDIIQDYFDETDRIDLRDFGFANFAEVRALATDTTTGLSLDLGGGDILIVNNFKRADFDAGDVLI